MSIRLTARSGLCAPSSLWRMLSVEAGCGGEESPTGAVWAIYNAAGDLGNTWAPVLSRLIARVTSIGRPFLFGCEACNHRSWMLTTSCYMEGHPIKRAVAKLVARGTPLGGGLIARRIGMAKLRRARLPILVERGENPEVLIIAFTGGQQKLHFPVYQFFETTQTLGCSRILLWDRYYMYYHHGVDGKRRDWPSLLDFLKREIARLRPEKVFCIGVSSGGYAAMIAGHYLGADYVHAFGPQTKIALDREAIRNARFRFNRWRMSISRRVFREVLDLLPMLQKTNGKTKFFVHYGSRHEIDRKFAERLVGLPSVVTLGYPINSHGVAVFLAKKKLLEHLLQVPNQNKLTDIARSCFGDQVVITVPGSGNPKAKGLRDPRSGASTLQSNPQMT